MNMRDLNTYQVKSNLIKAKNHLGMKFRGKEMCLGGETVESNRERSRKVRFELCWPYWYKLSNSRQIEGSREVSSFKEGRQKLISSMCPRQGESWWIEVTVEDLSRGQKFSRSIHLAIERCWDCDKKQLKSLTDKLGMETDGGKWDLNRADPIYTSSVILDISIGLERCRALKRVDRSCYRACVQGKLNLDGSRLLSRIYRGDRNFLDRST